MSDVDPRQYSITTCRHYTQVIIKLITTLAQHVLQNTQRGLQEYHSNLHLSSTQQSGNMSG